MSNGNKAAGEATRWAREAGRRSQGTEHHAGQVATIDRPRRDVGEQQEGEVWEAAMAAAHHRLDNLCVIIDYNKMQSDALNEDIMGLDSLRARWQAFNWPVIEIDGHDFTRTKEAFSRVKKLKGWPVVIIAHTIKGKGVSFMEGSPAWHGSVAIKDEEFLQAMKELDAAEEEVKEYQSWRV